MEWKSLAKHPITRLSISSLSIIGGVIASVCVGDSSGATALIVKESLNAAGGLGTEAIGSLLDGAVKSSASREEILKNGDLNRAIGRAIFTIILDESYISGEKAFENIGRLDETVWEKIANSSEKVLLDIEIVGNEQVTLTKDEIADITPDYLTKCFEAGTGKISNLTALTPDIWKAIIIRLLDDEAIKENTSAYIINIEKCAERLHLDFPKGLRKVLSADFKENGAAYASMQLRLSGEILHYTKANYQDNQEIKLKLDSLIERVGELQKFDDSKLKGFEKEFWQKAFDTTKNIEDIVTETSKDVKETLETAKRNETKIDKAIEILSEIVSPMPGNISPDFVNLPEMRTDIFGRDGEITAIEGFLRDEKEHLIIAAWTCLGKTSLLTKFLNKNLNETQDKSLLPDIFGKVIYLDCRRYDTFAGIAQHFATLLDMSLEFTEGREDEFLKKDIFPKIRDSKILLILDNFEAWQTDGGYKTREIGAFLNTIFHTNNSLRLIFLSWHLPHIEHEFDVYVSELDFVKEKLFEGLPDDIAVKLVREEGKKYCKTNSRVDLNTVNEADLIAFFKDVHNIPQAIRSMVHFVGRKQISFREFTDKYREKYKFEESDATNLADKRGNLLRPTNAMISLQISLLNAKAKNLLRHIAFYGIDVPEDILVLNESDIEQTDDNLRDELLHLSNDGLAIADVNRNDNVAFVQYHLHPFVFEAVRDNLPAFSDTHETYLESIADQMRGKTENAWENKLFYKQLAFAECWEKLEDCLIQTLNHSSRQFQRNLVDFKIALASQEIANAFAVKLTDEQRKQLRLKSEKLYLDYLEKNPKEADAYYNLGTLLAKDESRWMEAEAAYRQAIELNSNDADAYYNLGTLLAKDESRWMEAEAAYRQAIELNSDYAEAYGNLGVLLGKDESRWIDAEAAFRKAIELNPNHAEAYGNLAVLKAKSMGEEAKDEIIECLRKCLELNPAYKDWAKNNSDFDFIRDDVRFAEIVGD